MKIAAISDLHGHTNFPLPNCDVLVIAGDICVDRVGAFWTRHEPHLCLTWFNDNIIPWINPYIYDKKIGSVLFTWGNHDWTEKYDHYEVQKSLPPYWHLMVDRGLTVQKKHFWGSPWSNQFMNWAWMKYPEALKPHYDLIPEGIDVLISHQPPYGFGDISMYDDGSGDPHCGSKELKNRILEVKPKNVICGHMHSARGVYNTGDTTVYNVSVVNESYKLVNPVTEFII